MEIMNPVRRLKSMDQNPISSMMEPLPLFDSKTLVNSVEIYFREHPHQWLVGITENSSFRNELFQL
jgi:hypothetical protein